MAVLGRATLELNADAAKLEQDLGAAVAKGTALGTAIGTAVYKGVEAGVGKLREMIAKAIDFGDAVGKGAVKLGISPEDFTRIATAAEVADVPVGKLASSMKALSVNAVKAARDAESEVGRAFEAIGLDASQFGSDAGKNFDLVIKKLGEYEDSVELTAIGTKILGGSYVAMKPLIDEYEKLGKIAADVGLVMTEDQARASGAFKDNLKVLEIASRATGATLAGVLLPTLEKFSGFAVEAAKDTERLDRVARVADTGLKILATAASVTANAFKIVGDFVGATAAGIVQFLSGNFVGAIRVGIERFHGLREGLSEGVRDVEEIWQKNAAKVAAGADAKGEKLAAPMIRAKEKVEKARKEIDREMQDYLRLVKLQDEARQGAANDIAEIEKTRLADAERAESIRRALDPARELWAQIHEITTLWKGGFLDDDTAQNSIERAYLKINELNTQVAKAASDTDDWGRQIGLTFSSAFEDAISGGKKFQDVLKGIGQDLAKLITRKTITEPAGKAIEGLLSGFSFGNLFKGASQPDVALAEGGRLWAGETALVGERGPELITAAANGMVTPNHALGGGPVFNVDMRGASVEAVARLERFVQQLNGSLEARALGAFAQASRRGA